MKTINVKRTGGGENHLRNVPFARVFGKPEVHVACTTPLNHENCINQMRFQVSGSPEFHALYWETLKGPDPSHTWTLQALMVRKNSKPSFMKAVISFNGVREKDFNPEEAESLLKTLLRYQLPASAFSTVPSARQVCEFSDMQPLPQPDIRMRQEADASVSPALYSPEKRTFPEFLKNRTEPDMFVKNLRPGEKKDIRYFFCGRNSARGFAIFQAFDLDLQTQELLACLAPFVSSLAAGPLLKQYVEKLKKQPALAHLPLDRMEKAIETAGKWGLIAANVRFPAFLQIQPMFSHFLSARLRVPGNEDVRRAVEAAFLEHYTELDRNISDLLLSEKRRKKEFGQLMAKMEFDNLAAATGLAIDAGVSVLNTGRAIFACMNTAETGEQAAELGKMLLAKLENRDDEELRGRLGADLVMLTDRVGKCQMKLGQYSDAEKIFRKALAMLTALTVLDEKHKAGLSTLILRNMGRAAEKQGKWSHSEKYYRQALDVYTEFNDPYEQAVIFHHLGRVAGRQHLWEQACDYMLGALKLFIVCNDYHYQGMTLKNLFWLWKSSGEQTLPAAVADVMGWTVESVERLFAKQGKAS